MMGHRQGEQVALFYEFSLERQIPGDRLLRSIDRFVELDVLRRELAGFYSGIETVVSYFGRRSRTESER